MPELNLAALAASNPTPNSACYWLPHIEHVGALVPNTVFVPYDHRQLVAAIEDGEGYKDEFAQLVADVWSAMRDMGAGGVDGPVFIRTDLSSAKHDGPGSYLASTRHEIEAALSLTAQDNEMKFWLTGPTPRAFMVRHFLDLAAPFTAFGGHPIAREWRYFATAEGVICSHFYWPEHSILGPSDEAWPKLLADLASGAPPHELAEWARAAAAACPAATAWSVDFAEDVNGRWWLIDMATAESSWHPDHEVSP